MITPSELHDPVEYVPLRCVLVSSDGSLDVLQKPIGVHLEIDAPKESDVGIAEGKSSASNEDVSSLKQENATVLSTLRDALSRCLLGR